MNEAAHNIRQQFESYLDATVGTHGHLSEAPRNKVAALPYHLRDAFDFRLWDFHNQTWILVEVKGGAVPSPAQVAKYCALLEQKFGNRVVLLAADIGAPNRRRLIEHKVPFVVPGRQMYLPDLLIDLREYFRSPQVRTQKLLPSAQLILFSHLLRQRLERVHLTQIARLFHYTPMTAKRAIDSLEGADLCETERTGRDRFVKFVLPPLPLWEAASPFLTSPVEKELLVLGVPGTTRLFHAGQTALAAKTMVNDEAIPTFAVSRDDYRSWVRSDEMHEAPLAELATARMQVWSYSPAALAQGGAVDPLSLYVSLRDAVDERVQQAVDTLKREIETRWS